MAIVQDVVFTDSLGTASGNHIVDSTLIGNTVNVCLIGEGGAGGAGHSDGEGGGGGGAGGVVFGTMAANAGDTFTVTHTPANDRTTSGDGSSGGIISITNTRTNVTWTATGGGGGVKGDTGAGGTGGGGNGAGATVNTGGTGGDSGGSSGVAAVNGQTGGGTGGSPGGTAGADNTDGRGGGGGGGRGGLPSYVTTAFTNLGISEDPRNGGDGATSATDGPTSARGATSALYIDNDGEDGKIDLNTGDGLDELNFIGFGGGGAGGVGSNTTGNALGGAGGNAVAVINYQFAGQPPVVILTGNTTPSNPHVVEAGGSFEEPGVTTQDAAGNVTQDTLTVVMPSALVTPINGTVGSQHVITYTVTDADGVVSIPVERVCEIRDTIIPLIVLNGSSVIEVELNNSFTDPGAIGYDNGSGGSNTDGTYAFSEITVGGDTVNTAQLGSYDITYDLADASGNAALQVVRRVNVVTTAQTRANTTGPAQTPDGSTSQIRFSEIIAASQLFRSVSPVALTDRSLVDTTPRLLKDNSLDDLRAWFRDYGAPLNATRSLTSPDPGAAGNLSGKTSANSQVSMNNFKSYSALSTKIRVRPETKELYRNSNDARIQIAAWGPRNHTSGNGLLTIRIKPSYSSAWVTVENIEQQNGAEFTNLNRAYRSPSDGNSSRGTAGVARTDPNSTYNYLVEVKFTSQGTGSAEVTHDELSIDIGQSGSAALLYYHNTNTNFKWNGNNTSIAGTYSEFIIEHLGPIIERTAS